MSNLHIPGFELVEKIGEGGMAEVWKAHQMSLGRTVAIKILPPRLVTDPSDLQRFRTEATTAANLKHPGIVQIHDAHIGQDLSYIVMEFIDGYTVEHWIQQDGRLSEKDALTLLEHIARALDYAWKTARVIHCDIKPDNLMVDADGSIKISDLGLARAIHTMSVQATDQDIVGTPAYMAPEVVEGRTDLDCRTDIYAAGATLYHMTMGQPLFHGQTTHEIMDLQCSGVIADIRQANPGLTRPFCALMSKMLAKDRNARPVDWQAVQVDLTRVRKGRFPLSPLPASGASTIERDEDAAPAVHAPLSEPPCTHNGSSRPWLASAIGAALCLSVVGAFLWHSRPPAPLPAQARGAVPATTPSDRTLAAAPSGSASVASADVDRPLTQHQPDAGPATHGTMPPDHGKQTTGVTAGDDGATASDASPPAPISPPDPASASQDTAPDLGPLLDAIVPLLLDGKLKEARDLARASATNSATVSRQSGLQTLITVLDGAADMERRVLESFSSQKGTEISVELITGRQTLLVDAVGNGKVTGRHAMVLEGAKAFSTISFPLEALTTGERIKRMGTNNTPDVALAKGLLAFHAQAFPAARDHLFDTLPPLAERLIKAVMRAEQSARAKPSPEASGRQESCASASPASLFWSRVPATLRQDAILHYSFDKGTASDESAHAVDGEVRNATITDGKFGKAIEFDGRHSCVQVMAAGTLSGSRTFMFWINPKEYRATNMQLVKIGAQLGGENVVIRGTGGINAAGIPGEVLLSCGRRNELTGTPRCVTPGQWNHVAFVYNETRSESTSYINGKKGRTEKDVSLRDIDLNTLYFGGAQGAGSFAGTMDEVVVYRRALTAHDISTIYDAQK